FYEFAIYDLRFQRRRAEEINPLAVGGWFQRLVLGHGRSVGDAVGAPAVAGEKFAVGRNVVVDAPFAPREGVADAFAGFDVHARKPELFGARRLEIVPDPLAIVAEEFVT